MGSKSARIFYCATKSPTVDSGTKRFRYLSYLSRYARCCVVPNNCAVCSLHKSLFVLVVDLRQPQLQKMTKDKVTGLYEPLPKSLGGESARPIAAAVGSLLPYPPGVRQPPEEALNTAIRARALILDSDVKLKKPALQKDFYRVRRKGRPADGKIKIPKEEQRYELYLPLVKLWQDYAKSVLKEEKTVNYGDRVLRMDLHGALVEVVRSLDAGLVGVQGILVAETARTIVVVTKRNRALTIPKNVSVIRIRIGKTCVEISLPALQFRASERSARKIKKRYMPFM